jgi:hypothetical protein
MSGPHAIAVALLVAALASSQLPAQTTYPWALPSGFPPPTIPTDNPMTEAKVDLGRHLFYDTRLSGKFKAPILRNVAVTAPYMHDGSVATLEEAIDHYAAGGRTIATGAYASVGFVVPGASEPNDLGPAWWNEAVGRAFVQFVRDNEMAPAINRCGDGSRVRSRDASRAPVA